MFCCAMCYNSFQNVLLPVRLVSVLGGGGGGGRELGASCPESLALTSCANAFYFIHVS